MSADGSYRYHLKQLRKIQEDLRHPNVSAKDRERLLELAHVIAIRADEDLDDARQDAMGDEDVDDDS